MPDGHSPSRLSTRFLDDGRLHLSDGPIDLIIEAWGTPEAVRRAQTAAMGVAANVLDALCSELAGLRAPQPGLALSGPVARKMQAAVAPFAPSCFITPMAAVAGAVAEFVLTAMVTASPLDRAYVNNGGDIALHLDAGKFAVGIIDHPVHPRLLGTITLHAGDGVHGIATSGWHGRSHSLGIADAVTVLAATAAAADAAATVIANAIDLPGHPGILRVPARDLAPDSDLGDRPVTRAVPPLSPAEIDQALNAGLTVAAELRGRGLIAAACLHLQGQTRIEAPASLRFIAG